MTNPQGPPYGDPRPPAGNPQPPWAPPPRTGPAGPPPPPPYGYTAPPHFGSPPATGPQTSKGSSKRRCRFSDPISIVLIVVIVLALVAACLLAVEIYARNVAHDKVRAATECVTQDTADVSFGGIPPFLWQHWTGDYTNISITTAGNQIRDAKGMKAEVDIHDVRLQDTANSKGTIGAIDATITWSSQGILETIQDSIPVIGNLVSGVTTDPDKGTIELEAPLGSTISAKPAVVDGGLALQMVSLSGLGFTLPRETVQPALDAFSEQLTSDYPLGIHADSVEVTESGVIARFSSRNAEIPKESENPCFERL